MKVAVVDYQAGNLDSVCRALGECGADPWVAAEPRELERAERIVLPGVGSFAAGMQHLRDGGWIEGLEQEVRKVGIPFLGICLGMQLMARSGEEGGGAQGLGWIDAQAVRLASGRASAFLTWAGTRSIGRTAAH